MGSGRRRRILRRSLGSAPLASPYHGHPARPVSVLLSSDPRVGPSGREERRETVGGEAQSEIRRRVAARTPTVLPPKDRQTARPRARRCLPTWRAQPDRQGQSHPTRHSPSRASICAESSVSEPVPSLACCRCRNHAHTHRDLDGKHLSLCRPSESARVQQLKADGATTDSSPELANLTRIILAVQTQRQRAQGAYERRALVKL